ncbi:ATP phosphoribosyltransferase [Falsarthrobacter nasiphocae]|uniref:ATP phosphoribosyltransferase n=1 Tax=Falsarthrobacter nasiphocae TaxID=189863 RepID=A0AAE4C5M7_9MICC|nr:ATP phosphoribosyltransferase [Falsarthrobacter nasiphocae]MDR6891232.1 ATP phosphoribosyltransferase [Falsarthrobacter nasiphocae]
MLRVAVPNKGALSETASGMLREAGYRQSRDRRELVLVDPENEVEFFFLRPRDIAVYVGQGILDAGITGRDLFLDAEVDAEEVLQLGFGRSTFRLAAPAGRYSSVNDLEGLRIATSFETLLGDHLAERGVSASIVRLDGAVESSIQLGVADAIADVVETGNTLRAAGMDTFGEPILASEAIVIANPRSGNKAAIDVMLRRLQGVLVAKQYVMLDYDVHVDQLEAAIALTPGLESPTISALNDPAWAAVRAMVKQSETNTVMDELYAVGARAILVTRIHACRI